MLQKIPLANKPICAIEAAGYILFGDARGNICAISQPFTCPVLLCSADAPVSAIVSLDDRLYYGTWDGTVHYREKTKKLSINMVKAMAHWRGRLLVSVDEKLIVLDLDLEKLEEYDLPAKIYSMNATDEGVMLGMGCGTIGRYCGSMEFIYNEGRDASILATREGLCGDTYGRLRRGDKIISSSEGWIRSIWDETLFSSRKDVIQHGKRLYQHDDDVISVLRVSGTIVSFGLDYCYKIYSTSASITEQEEDEMLQKILLG